MIDKVDFVFFQYFGNFGVVAFYCGKIAEKKIFHGIAPIREIISQKRSEIYGKGKQKSRKEHRKNDGISS